MGIVGTEPQMGRTGCSMPGGAATRRPNRTLTARRGSRHHPPQGRGVPDPCRRAPRRGRGGAAPAGRVRRLVACAAAAGRVPGDAGRAVQAGCPWSRCSPTWTGQRWKARVTRPGSRPVSRQRSGRHRHRRARAPGGGQLSVLPGGKTWKGAAVSGPAALKAAGLLTATAASIVIAVPALPSLPSLPGHHAQAFGGLVPDSGPPGADTRTRAVLRPPACTPVRGRGYGNARPASSGGGSGPGAVGAVSAAVSGPCRGARRGHKSRSLSARRGARRDHLLAVGGPVSWTASSSSPDLDADGSGTLGSGVPGVIGLRVGRGSLAGTGTVTITDGHGNATRVRVVWVAFPVLGL